MPAAVAAALVAAATLVAAAVDGTAVAVSMLGRMAADADWLWWLM